MKKVLSLLVVMALLLAPLTTARADLSDNLKEAAQGLGEALDWVGRAMTAIDLAKKVFGKDEVQELDRKLREVQIAFAAIPSLRTEIADIRGQLQERPTRQEVHKLLAGLRADMEVELRKIEARVGKVEKRVDKLTRRVDEHDAQLKEKGVQIEELQMREALRSPSAYERPSAVNTKRGRLLLANGGEVYDAVLTGVDTKGVRCILGGKEKHYPPGEVLTISTQAGFFHYDAETKDFRFRPHSSDPTAAGQRPQTELKPIAGDSLNKIDTETLVILKAMRPGELDDLRGFAERRGYNWDKLELEKQLPLVRQKLQQDHRTEILRIISDTNCTELQALRRVIHRLAEQKQR